LTRTFSVNTEHPPTAMTANSHDRAKHVRRPFI
jgi:hypothetical protein